MSAPGKDKAKPDAKPSERLSPSERSTREAIAGAAAWEIDSLLSILLREIEELELEQPQGLRSLVQRMQALTRGVLTRHLMGDDTVTTNAMHAIVHQQVMGGQS